MAEAGVPWAIRKIANFMKITMEFEAKDDGLSASIQENWISIQKVSIYEFSFSVFDW